MLQLFVLSRLDSEDMDMKMIWIGLCQFKLAKLKLHHHKLSISSFDHLFFITCVYVY